MITSLHCPIDKEIYIEIAHFLLHSYTRLVDPSKKFQVQKLI